MGDDRALGQFAMLDAEENGVTSKNVDEMMKSPNPEVKRMLGVEGKFGEGLGIYQ